MTKVLVLYYSSYGHTETLAQSIAEGAREVDGAEVTIKRVAETAPDSVVENAGFKTDQDAPLAEPGELENYDCIIVGTPTRFGNMCAQMRQFFDQTGGAWAQGKLIGKVGSVFTSTGTGGGQETTITSTWNTLAHHGMVIVGLPYSSSELQITDELVAGSPYGAATIAGADGKREIHELELKLCRDQGRHATQIAAKLAA